MAKETAEQPDDMAALPMQDRPSVFDGEPEPNSSHNETSADEITFLETCRSAGGFGGATYMAVIEQQRMELRRLRQENLRLARRVDELVEFSSRQCLGLPTQSLDEDDLRQQVREEVEGELRPALEEMLGWLEAARVSVPNLPPMTLPLASRRAEDEETQAPSIPAFLLRNAN